jgi:hypothetical protein
MVEVGVEEADCLNCPRSTRLNVQMAAVAMVLQMLRDAI